MRELMARFTNTDTQSLEGMLVLARTTFLDLARATRGAEREMQAIEQTLLNRRHAEDE